MSDTAKWTHLPDGWQRQVNADAAEIARLRAALSLAESRAAAAERDADLLWKAAGHLIAREEAAESRAERMREALSRCTTALSLVKRGGPYSPAETMEISASLKDGLSALAATPKEEHRR